MSRLYYTFLLFIFLGSVRLQAQDDLTHADHDHHHEHRNELGIANAPVYFVKEEIVSYGLHVHLVRNLLHSRFGYGIGYERIFDEHGHNTYSALVSYRIDRVMLIVAPGATIEDEEPGEAAFAVHVEATYEFELGDLHLGPVVEFAYDPEDIHLSLGLHVGIGF